MSSRALRKAQRQREEELARQKEMKVDDSDEEDVEVQHAAPPKQSLFAMLGGDEEDDEEDDEGDLEGEMGSAPNVTEADELRKQKLAKKKKKKKAGPKKNVGKTSTPRADQPDDIDLALRSLAVTAVRPTEGASGVTSAADPELEKVSALLAVDSQHLNVANEMRRLFGRAALENDGGEAPPARRRRGHQQAGLGGAVAGHNMAGRGLAALGLRRNIFITGKEEWPRGTGGGLGMELVAQEDDSFTEYRIVHNGAYQDVQRQFESCRESMDPERMIQLLQYNPYHISTLLQVSEIAKQEGDHTTSGDLLERALFSFGRSVHSTFASRLARGKAGLDFSRPENREFWLAGWRYLHNLGQRGTWRTALEWGKLLLSLDPEGDPYAVRLLLDQLALRARQPQKVLDLGESVLYTHGEPHPAPHLGLAIALAHHQLGQGDEARRALFSVMQRTPWLLPPLFKELGVPLPESLSGVTPTSDRNDLLAQLYATRAKDLWSSPEASSLLQEIALIPESPLKGTEEEEEMVPRRQAEAEARHVLLADVPALTALLPRDLTARAGAVGDPLPPEDSLPSYATGRHHSTFEHFDLEHARHHHFDGSSESSDSGFSSHGDPSTLTALQILRSFFGRQGVGVGEAGTETREEEREGGEVTGEVETQGANGSDTDPTPPPAEPREG
ncbi:MAG: hypothetical protein M1832_000120 [Thelocarpon impressellum]|nr:MAG: hypothetical protein M1832_000120 [Thelocarpon impressellum]